MFAIEPLKLSDRPPEPVTFTPPALTASSRPEPTTKLAVTSSPPASTSTKPTVVIGVATSSSTTMVVGATITGASLMARTVMDAVSVASENALVPPRVAVSARSPLAPTLRSQATKVMALPMLPLKSAAGRKYRRVEAGSAASSRAEPSLTVPSASQLLPLSSV